MEDYKTEEKDVLRLIKNLAKTLQERSGEEQNEEMQQFMTACESFEKQIKAHAEYRSVILNARQHLSEMIKEDAVCPRCHSREFLKPAGTEINDKGWKSNRYKCRRCNITFVWNTPNNPWDIIPYAEDFIKQVETRITAGSEGENGTESLMPALEKMRESLEQLKPVVETSDKQYAEFEEREKALSDLVHEFRKQLMIKKIQLEE
jgi:transposase-like protein